MSSERRRWPAGVLRRGGGGGGGGARPRSLPLDMDDTVSCFCSYRSMTDD